MTMENIDDLDDDLLVKILSFLPAKTAVVTSVLSKRWSCLWKQRDIDYLELCDECSETVSCMPSDAWKRFVSMREVVHCIECSRREETEKRETIFISNDAKVPKTWAFIWTKSEDEEGENPCEAISKGKTDFIYY